MAEDKYQLSFSGQQIDTILGEVSGKQDALVSGTNIKTINQTSLLGSGNIAVQPTLVSGTNIKTINNNSILGEGNLEIQGGGGASIRVIDATNPDDWDSDNDMPSQSALEDVVANSYQLVSLINVPAEEEGVTYSMTLYLNASVNGEGYALRSYAKFDAGDEDHDEPPFIQEFNFSKEGDDPVEMSIEAYPLSGGGSSDSSVVFLSLGWTGVDNDELIIYYNDLQEISNAVSFGKEALIRVEEKNSTPLCKPMYFRLSELNHDMIYIDIDGNSESVAVPTFEAVTSTGKFYAQYDRTESGSNYVVYKIYEGAKRYTPDTIDISNNVIGWNEPAFVNEIFNSKFQEIALNLNGDIIQFHKTYQDDTNGSEKVLYTSHIISDSANYGKICCYVFALEMSGGNLLTSIYKNNIQLVAV